jgi:putative ABC transport system substrate-binding protein
VLRYGPSIPDFFRRAADYVDKILREGSLGDIPVQQPTKFDLVINLNTAKARHNNASDSAHPADEVIK